MLKQVGSNFSTQAGGQAHNRFCQPAFEGASGMLKFVKNAFNTLPNALQQAFKAVRMLDFWFLRWGVSRVLPVCALRGACHSTPTKP